MIPSYADRLVFVDAISDDPSARELAADFQFQYIPTSFFIAPDGTVTDSFSGPLTEEEMRGYLEELVAE